MCIPLKNHSICRKLQTVIKCSQGKQVVSLQMHRNFENCQSYGQEIKSAYIIFSPHPHRLGQVQQINFVNNLLRLRLLKW